MTYSHYQNKYLIVERHRAKECPEAEDPDTYRCTIKHPGYGWTNTTCKACGEEMHVGRAGVSTCSDGCRKALSRERRKAISDAAG